jgi:hypothetical protein
MTRIFRAKIKTATFSVNVGRLVKLRGFFCRPFIKVGSRVVKSETRFEHPPSKLTRLARNVSFTVYVFTAGLNICLGQQKKISLLRDNWGTPTRALRSWRWAFGPDAQG